MSIFLKASLSSDPDPCTYTFCKSNSDVCKLRIDYESMNIASPVTYDSARTAADGYKWGLLVGDCNTDTLTVSNPGGAVPPVICGVNTGQHMWIPASDSCNQINIDIDTASSGITRTWQIKVTQYECNDLKMPQEDCLQWHEADTGILFLKKCQDQVPGLLQVRSTSPRTKTWTWALH